MKLATRYQSACYLKFDFEVILNDKRESFSQKIFKHLEDFQVLGRGRLLCLSFEQVYTTTLTPFSKTAIVEEILLQCQRFKVLLMLFVTKRFEIKFLMTLSKVKTD